MSHAACCEPEIASMKAANPTKVERVHERH
jgi:hypothetical protein